MWPQFKALLSQIIIYYNHYEMSCLGAMASSRRAVAAMISMFAPDLNYNHYHYNMMSYDIHMSIYKGPNNH